MADESLTPDGRVVQMLREAKCPQPYCNNKGERLVPVASWYEMKKCDWCKERASLLGDANG